MLVSYDAGDIVDCLAEFGLQGHQNVGELRRITLSVDIKYFYCKVTRMLVSYDISTAAVYPTAIVLPSKCRFVTKLQ